MFRANNVHAVAHQGKSVDDLQCYTAMGNPVVVRIRDLDSGYSPFIVVDGITTRGGGLKTPVVAVRDPAGGEQYYSPISTFETYFTGEVVIPR